jgi:hypothetical protein
MLSLSMQLLTNALSRMSRLVDTKDLREKTTLVFIRLLGTSHDPPCLPMFFVTLVQLLLLDSAPEVISLQLL